MQQSWDGQLYHSLIKRTVHFPSDSTAIALQLYQEMAHQAGNDITWRTFELLFRLAHRKEHLNTYFTVSVIALQVRCSIETLLKY